MNATDTSQVFADGKGLRIPDPDKGARFDLLPPEAMWALAKSMGDNLQKYPERNWERGMGWGHCFGAILRHAWKFWRGEDYDVDAKTGVRTHHMVAVMWNAMALFTYQCRSIGQDDRGPKVEFNGAHVASPSAAINETNQALAALDKEQAKSNTIPRFTYMFGPFNYGGVNLKDMSDRTVPRTSPVCSCAWCRRNPNEVRL